VHRSVPILSIVSWLGCILLIWRGPFTSIGMIPFANFLSYFVCGIIFAAIAGVGAFRWARLVSFALSVPAALLGCAGFFGTLLLLVYDRHASTLFQLSLCFTIYLLMIFMPVFWVMQFRKLSRRALTNR
jgi:hypothetical protein